MRDIEVVKTPWERIDRHHQAPESVGLNDAIRLVDAASGEVIAIQYLLGDELDKQQAELTRYLRFKVDFHEQGKGDQARLSGMKYPNNTFGFTDPKPLRRRWACSPSLLWREQPEVRRLLQDFTHKQWDVFATYAPDLAAAHEEAVRSRVHPDWLIDGVPWTSGIINKTAALPYHKDAGNIVGSFSSMLCLRKNIGGGALHLPEYGITLGIPHGSITIFNGQAAWHGVTPLVTSKEGYRFTMVWYAKNGMCKCLSADDEIAEAQQRATRR